MLAADANDIVQFVLTARDIESDTLIANLQNVDDVTSDTDPMIEYQVTTGDVFKLEIGVQDLRHPQDSIGVFRIINDIVISQSGVLEPALGEFQQIILENEILNLSPNDTGTFSLAFADARGTSVSRPIQDLISLDGQGRDSLVAQMIVDLFGVLGRPGIDSIEDVSVNVRLKPVLPGPNGDSTGALFIDVLYASSTFINQDIPQLEASVVVNGQTQPVENRSEDVFVAGEFNPQALEKNFETITRQLKGPDAPQFDLQLYGDQERGTMSRIGVFEKAVFENGSRVDRFDSVGVLGPIGNFQQFFSFSGQTFSNQIAYDAFSVPVRAIAPANNVVVRLATVPGNENSDGVQVYSRDQGAETVLPENIALAPSSRFVLDITDPQTLIAVDDVFTLDEDMAVTMLDVQANDVIVEVEATTLIITTPASLGTVTTDPSGVLLYQPNPDAFGTDVFTYSLAADGLSASATVTIDITAVNDPPQALDDVVIASAGRSTSFSDGVLLDNDFDTDGDLLSISRVSQGSDGGSIVLENGQWVYTPADFFVGAETFTVTISDDALESTSALTINVDYVLEPVEVNLDDGMNVILVRADDGNLQIVDTVAETTLIDRPLGKVASLAINGGRDNDQLTIDHSIGGPVVFAGSEFVFNGGDGSDAISVIAPIASQVRIGSPLTLTEQTDIVVDPSEASMTHRSIQTESVSVNQATQVFFDDRPFVIADGTLALEAEFPVDLPRWTAMDGGRLMSASTIALGAGGTLQVNGVIDAAIATQPGSLIEVIGDLSIGDANSVDGLMLGGEMIVDRARVSIADANAAVIRGTVLLSSDINNTAVIAADQGMVIDFGSNVTGRGVLETPEDIDRVLINDGQINGQIIDESGTTPGIELTGWIKGVGQLDGVVVSGTLSPGFSPTDARHGHVVYSESATVIAEIGGTDPGSQYDRILHLPGASLDGSLRIDLIDGFLPSAGHQFNLIEAAEELVGQFANVELPDLGVGLDWEIDSTPDQITAAVIVDVGAVTSGISASVEDGRLVIRTLGGQIVPVDGDELTIDADLDREFESSLVWKLNKTDLMNGELIQVLSSDQITLRVRNAGWTNFVSPFDVNGSGEVSALDALQVINELNAQQFSESSQGVLLPPADVANFPNLFYDVSRDGRVTALDALRIINELNVQDVRSTAEPWTSPETDSVAIAAPEPERRTDVGGTDSKLTENEWLPLADSRTDKSKAILISPVVTDDDAATIQTAITAASTTPEDSLSDDLVDQYHLEFGLEVNVVANHRFRSERA